MLILMMILLVGADGAVDRVALLLHHRHALGVRGAGLVHLLPALLLMVHLALLLLLHPALLVLVSKELPGIVHPNNWIWMPILAQFYFFK